MSNQAPFAYHGAQPAINTQLAEAHGWKPLRRVSSNTGNIVANPETVAIPTGEWSELISVADCLEFAFIIDAQQAAQVAAGSNLILIERSRTATATLAADINTYASLSPATAWSTLSWNSGQFLGGWFRIKNNSGATIAVGVQKRLI